MKTISKKLSSYVSALLFLTLIMGLAMPMHTARAIPATAIVYDAMLAPLPPNMPSLGFQATQTAEFGDYVHLAGTNRELRNVTVSMSDWALYADYSADVRYMGDSVNWTHPITVNIYSNHLGVNGVPDTLLGTVTQMSTIPWRPIADPTCTTPTAWRAGDGLCYNGFAFNLTFDMSSLNVTLPDDIIVGIAYNTQTWGAAPIGVAGPYSSLNVGVLGTATVGTDDNTDKVFWNTLTPANYTDGGVAGIGIFRGDTNWTPNGTVNIQITAAPVPSDVYVNSTWGLVLPGADPDGSGPASQMGYDAFTTIQNGIIAVSSGGTVNVAVGTYTEDLTIDKPLTLLGPNSSINPNTGTREAEAVLHPATSNPDPAVCTVMAYLSVSNITIKGFTFDGDNPLLTSGIMIGTADVDACEIMAGYEGMGNITVENNILKNSTYSGIDFYNFTNSAATSGNYIRYNIFEDIGETTYNRGVGVLIYNNFYADITDNVFTGVRTGIQTGNFSAANPGTTGSISNNQIGVWRLGIFHNLAYTNASALTMSNNTITAETYPGADKWNGILLSSIGGTVNATVSGNTIVIPSTVTFVAPGYTAGYNVWNDTTTAPLTISGGTVTGGDYGIFVNNFEGYTSNADNTAIKIDSVTVLDSVIAGVYVKDSPSNTNSATVYANVQNSTIDTNATGILVEGVDATALANFNKLSGNTTAGITNTSGVLMNGISNWWGAASGPGVVGLGTGDKVSTNVNYSPWCGDIACADLLTKITPTVSASGGPFTYDGASHTATVTGSVAGVVSNIKYNGFATLPTNAGTYVVTANFVPEVASTYNTLTDAAAGSITINKAAATITVNGYTGIYDGLAHGASVAAASGVNSEDLTASVNLGPTFTNVPGGTANWSFTNGNYNSQNGSAAIVINKKAASVMAVDNSKLIGAVDPSLSTTNSGFIAGDLGAGKIIFSATRELGEAIATYVITPAAEDASTGLLGNYTVTFNNGTFTISDKFTPTVSASGGPFTYDGASHAVTVTGSIAGTVSNIKYNGLATAPTNAGTYVVTANFVPDDAATYNSLTDAAAGSVIINKAMPTLSVTNSPVDFNGAPQAAIVTGSVPGTASNIKYNGSAITPTAVGTYAVTADFTPTDAVNYNSLFVVSAGDFVINIGSGGLGIGGDTTGVFRPSNGIIFLKNTNTSGIADIGLNYGLGGDYPITGDWDGNGTDTIGVYRDGSFYLRNSNTVGFAEIVFAFGQPGDQPVAGDWDGDGIDTIGVYRNGLFLLRNSNSAGAVDTTFALGNPGDVGIAGDWNGDGMDTTGVFRPSNGIIFLKNANTTGFADIALNYGLAGDMPVTGDWNNDGIDTIGVYRNAQFLLRNSNTIGFAEIVFALGNPGDMPIAGNWDGIP